MHKDNNNIAQGMVHERMKNQSDAAITVKVTVRSTEGIGEWMIRTSINDVTTVFLEHTNSFCTRAIDLLHHKFNFFRVKTSFINSLVFCSSFCCRRIVVIGYRTSLGWRGCGIALRKVLCCRKLCLLVHILNLSSMRWVGE